MLQGFTKKTAVFKIEKFSGVLSDDREGKIIEISTLNFLAIGRLLWKTLYFKCINHPSYLPEITNFLNQSTALKETGKNEKIAHCESYIP